ncbi:VOC family protein [Actinomycetospora straminea]|uniref:VOC family protein n=1 Tax=Actinomycetospora straminea TaxID=663607 RepID=A0ABP9EP96_9PSEU|nr:VOC family protein [Actinomycetospora straminea]MDD7935460.1 VOC family protein [Actinomycetospora straminea]
MAPIVGSVVLSTPDPAGLAAFYRALLGWVTVEGGDPTFVRLRSPERERPGISFQLEHGHLAPAWPAREGEQRMHAHLDLLVAPDALEAEVARAEALGAVREGHQPAEGVVVMRDPHGHLFCLFVPGA